MRTLPALMLSVALAATPRLAGPAGRPRREVPAQNTTQLQSEADQNNSQAQSAKAAEKRSKKAAKADKNAAHKEKKAAKGPAKGSRRQCFGANNTPAVAPQQLPVTKKRAADAALFAAQELP